MGKLLWHRPYAGNRPDQSRPGKPFNCAFCQRVFRSQSAAAMHEREVHKKLIRKLSGEYLPIEE